MCERKLELGTKIMQIYLGYPSAQSTTSNLIGTYANFEGTPEVLAAMKNIQANAIMGIVDVEEEGVSDPESAAALVPKLWARTQNAAREAFGGAVDPECSLLIFITRSRFALSSSVQRACVDVSGSCRYVICIRKTKL